MISSSLLFEQAELTIQIEVIKEHPFFSDLSIHKAPYGHTRELIVLPCCRNALKNSVMGSLGSKAHRNLVSFGNHPVFCKREIGGRIKLPHCIPHFFR